MILDRSKTVKSYVLHFICRTDAQKKRGKIEKRRPLSQLCGGKQQKIVFFSLIFSYAIQLNFSILSDFVRYRKFPIETILHGKFDRKIFRFFQGFSGGNSVIEKGKWTFSIFVTMKTYVAFELNRNKLRSRLPNMCLFEKTEQLEPLLKISINGKLNFMTQF